LSFSALTLLVALCKTRPRNMSLGGTHSPCLCSSSPYLQSALCTFFASLWL